MARRKIPGYLQQRGTASYRWTVGVAGEVHAETIRAESRAEAVRIIRKRYRELEPALERHSRRRRTTGAPTMTALIDQFLAAGLGTTRSWTARRAVTQRKYASTIKQLRVFYVDRGDPPADRVENLDDYLHWRIGQGLVSSTLAQERVVASAVFDWAVRQRILDTNPARASAAPKVKPRDPIILTDPELERLLEDCGDPMLALYVLVQAEAGLRCESEVLWLQWADVNRTPGFLEVVSGRDGHLTKSGETREVPITKRLQAALRDHAATFKNDGTDSPWLFHDVFGARIGRLDDAFRRARNRARKARRPGDVVLPAIFKRAHDLRARRITTWLDEGQNVVHVMAWVGHKDLSTTQRYYRYCRKPLQAPRLAPTEGGV